MNCNYCEKTFTRAYSMKRSCRKMSNNDLKSEVPQAQPPYQQQQHKNLIQQPSNNNKDITNQQNPSQHALNNEETTLK